MKGFPKVAMIEKNKKYIYHILKKIVEVNLAEDNEESNNLLNAYSTNLKGREEDFENWLKEKTTWRKDMISQKATRSDIKPRVREQLKFLGYLQNGGEE